MTLSEDLVWRGFIKDKTFADVGWLDQPQTFYLGADAGSANSLTIGNLAIFMLARRLLEGGWTTILLMGGATSLIGDPGGKDGERDLVSKETIDGNIDGIRFQVERLFSDKPFVLVNNYDWFKDMGYLQFLREVGKLYSMTELVQRDFIAERMGQNGSGISYAEFSYTLIQGYDFYTLNKEHNCVLQIGGSDQWGNMLSGVPLVRKKSNAEAHAMSMPLIIDKTTGKKFGKSEAGAVWLDETKTSVYQFYQFWLNVDDAGVIDYIKIYTMLSREEIDSLAERFWNDRAGREGQKVLAHEVTTAVHGRERADAVKRASEVLFSGVGMEDLQPIDIEMLSKELTLISLDSVDSLVTLLVSTGLASSNTEARRFIDDGAVYINGVRAVSQDIEPLKTQLLARGFLLIRRGKNKYILAR